MDQRPQCKAQSTETTRGKGSILQDRNIGQ